MKINRYQFDKIVSRTKNSIHPIRRGEENGVYFEYLAMIELLMHDFHLKHKINGRQAKEILQLVLYDILAVTDHTEYDCTQFEEACYRACADRIESLFMPEKSPELQKALNTPIILDDDYFELSRKTIVRIHESVTQWTNDFGAYGYFNFIAPYINSEILTSKKYLVEDRFLKSR